MAAYAGLDARAAAIVMRSVKNTVRTGRTVVCTIHQPSLEIFQVTTLSLLSTPCAQLGCVPACTPACKSFCSAGEVCSLKVLLLSAVSSQSWRPDQDISLMVDLLGDSLVALD